jgi:hypothetical protein
MARRTDSNSNQKVEKGQPGTLRVLVALTVPALAGIAIYSGEHTWSVFALSILIAACAFALGALLGFLFGIPQYFAKGPEATPTPNQATKATYQPNTNLTQVSDWLTKIIIGVGLVQFGQLTDTLGKLGDSLESSLGGKPAGKPFGIALVVGFFVIGFLIGYLYTRLRLQWAFAAADRGAFEDLAAEKVQEQSEADAKLLKLASEQLDQATPARSQEELQEAAAEASPSAKEQVKMQARATESQQAEALIRVIDQTKDKDE